MLTIFFESVTKRPQDAKRKFASVSDDRYFVKVAENPHEVESALRLRYEVFNVELGNRASAPAESPIEFDSYDFKCRHLIVVSRVTGETVGTYRLNSVETAHSVHGFYSSNEFTVEDLPEEVLQHGIEIGRACIAAEHRNTKVLFLLWKALLAYLEHANKRYFFGCCSIFTQDLDVGRNAYRQLIRDGHLHPAFSVVPCRNAISLIGDESSERVELPALYNMYLRIGAKVCGPPMIDREFGTIDFFVVFDVADLGEKYRRMFSRKSSPSLREERGRSRLG
jgi:putative hemolysin